MLKVGKQGLFKNGVCRKRHTPCKDNHGSLIKFRRNLLEKVTDRQVLWAEMFACTAANAVAGFASVFGMDIVVIIACVPVVENLFGIQAGKEIGDGNVLRLVSRLTDDPTPIDSPLYKKQVKQRLEEIYPEAAGEFTQALMELGATLCGPNRKPECEHCPCKDFCLGYARGTAEMLPVKAPKKEKRREDRTVFLLSCEGCFALTKRPSKGLLAGLWQFPDTPGSLELEEALEHLRSLGMEPKEIFRKTEKKHIFTHIQWDMTGYYLEIAKKVPNFHWITAEEVEREAALPTAYRQFWEDRV